MTASISYKDGSTWRTITAPSYKDGSTWRTLSEVHYKDGSTWRQVFGAGGGTGVFLADPGGATSTDGTDGRWTLKSTGALELLQNGSTSSSSISWLSPNPDSATASLYEARRTQVSGSLGVTFNNCASGVWGQMNIDRNVSVTPSGGITRTNVSTWDIRLISAPGTILATATVTVSADP